MLIVKEWRGHCSDKELTAIRIWAGILQGAAVSYVVTLVTFVYTCDPLTTSKIDQLTAMLSRPGLSCFKAKFSSANDRVP